jgi:hypothetical protein
VQSCCTCEVRRSTEHADRQCERPLVDDIWVCFRTRIWPFRSVRSPKYRGYIVFSRFAGTVVLLPSAELARSDDDFKNRLRSTSDNACPGSLNMAKVDMHLTEAIGLTGAKAGLPPRLKSRDIVRH